MDFSYVHIRYFIGYVYHICLQDTIQSTLSLCLLCQAMLLPMPLRPLLLTTRSGFTGHGFMRYIIGTKRIKCIRMGCQSALYCVHGIFRHLQRRSENILHFFKLNIHQLNITTRSKVRKALVNKVKGPVHPR